VLLPLSLSPKFTDLCVTSFVILWRLIILSYFYPFGGGIVPRSRV
jgi:hypothetical protein